MENLVNVLMSNVIIAGALAMFAYALTKMWHNPRLAHALWLLVLLKLVTPPILHLSLPRFIASSSHSVPAPTNGGEHGNHDVDPLMQPGTVGSAIAVNSQVVSPTSPVDQPFRVGLSGLSVLHWQSAWLLVWAGGIVISTGIAARGYIRFRKLVALATDADRTLVAEVQHLADALKMKRCPTVQLVDARIPPLVWSGVQPRILLPRKLFASLDSAQRQAVLVHELAHIRRGDHLTRWFEVGVLILFWWYPVAWLASRHLRLAEEECCDAWVIWMLPESRREYSLALSHTVEFLTESPSCPALAATTFGSSPLKRRIEMIMRRDLNRRLSPGAFAIVFVLASAILPVVAQTTEPAKQPPEVPTVDAKVTRAVEVPKNAATPGDKKDLTRQPTEELRLGNCTIGLIDDIEIASPVEGVIAEFLVRAGDKVKKGQVLARLDDGDAKLMFLEARSKVTEAEPNRLALTEAMIASRQATAEYDRAKELAVEIPDAEIAKLRNSKERAELLVQAAQIELDIAKSRYEVLRSALELAENNLARRTFRAPIEGVVLDISRQAGEHIETGKPICRIIDLSRLRAEAYVKGHQAKGLRGRPVRIEMNPPHGTPVVAN